MKPILLLLFLIAFSVCIASTSFSQKKSTVLSFKENSNGYKPDDKPETGTKKLQAFISIDTLQKASDKGLQLTLIVRNNKGYYTSIVNPLDLLGISITNERGIKQDLIDKGARFKIHTKNGFRYKEFIIERVLINGSPTKLDLNKETAITVPANGILRVFLAVNKINPPEGYNKPFYDSTEDIRQAFPKGKYILNASLTMLAAKSVPGKYKILETDPVKILYGTAPKQ